MSEATEPTVKLCSDCESREIDAEEEVCVVCWFDHNDENPDGNWVNTPHGWVYE